MRTSLYVFICAFCLGQFLICDHCDRKGYKYCSEACREAGRKASCRKAQKKYVQTVGGKEKCREADRRYKQKTGVTEQTAKKQTNNSRAVAKDSTQQSIKHPPKQKKVRSTKQKTNKQTNDPRVVEEKKQHSIKHRPKQKKRQTMQQQKVSKIEAIDHSSSSSFSNDLMSSRAKSTKKAKTVQITQKMQPSCSCHFCKGNGQQKSSEASWMDIVRSVFGEVRKGERK